MGLRVSLDGWGKIPPPPGFDPWAVQPVASCYTDYAIPAHNLLQEQQKNIHNRLAIECWVANIQRQVVTICLMFLIKHLNNLPSISFGLQPGQKCWLFQLHRLFSVGRLITNDKRWKSWRKVVLLFLCTFAKLRKETISFVISVRLSAWKIRIPLDGFHEILYLRIFRKSVEKIQVWQNCL
jgi:hypothetical protein